ncbi:helix-turn-helix transcriptional regulator [Alkalibacter rhizosphaerae]|uniref:Helix-turn-helix transcriptional regulator n=1 Tax=Alkalibacter rhizosphaerae TaxID=2815577 RepID=A0A974XDY8_9FIRM|nr:helix-turn-helix transcriptional regulator [Alkalibacter rhizosphaerae]QSX08068.1 helix-turn-helix transcriptional regulator [Alkalibacter rhizosphaerae]
MAVSYNKLWKLLVDRRMSKADLRKAVGVSPNTFTKMNKNEEVSLTVLGRICKTLDCDYGDIISYVSGEDELESTSEQNYLC